jgi:hypothetical protein
MIATALSPERQRIVDAMWRRSSAWRAPFDRKLNAIMVESFYNDDDYDDVRAYLIAVYQPKELGGSPS